jgi:asparagine synthase (glutamine-hydrolysing)
MCGINGFTFSDEALIQKMNNCLAHRGPDDQGTFVDEQISLGHRRLSIIDLSEKGHQPMESMDRRHVLIFNGEIYNFNEIKDELAKVGHKFDSVSDSEVILTAYKEYGAECLQKFNGMFAFAIWDKREKELFIARDRIGIKPLYYYHAGKRLIFSSEIKSILKHPVERKLNMDALNIYFRTLYIPAPLTMFDCVKKLEPGSYLLYKNSEVEVKKYWQPNDFTDLTNKEDTIQQIQELMKDSVKLRLNSDRPVGVFLSGGVDSSVITGLVCESMRDKVKTFSVGFDVRWKGKYNADADLAKQTSKYFGTEHHNFVVTGKDVLDNIEDVVYHMDEPVSNATQIATYLLSKHTKEHIVVGLGGDGGDELFGGYERYRLSRLISRVQSLPKFSKHILLASLKVARLGKGEKLKLPAGVERYLTFMAQKEYEVGRVLNSEHNDKTITQNFFDSQFFKTVVSSPKSEVQPDFEKQFMWTDIRSWLVDESLLRTDKMTMAHGLEQRVPILDHRLVELSLKIPTKWKINGKEGKAIFREAMKEYIPQYVLNQPKRGWTSPASEWLRTDLKGLVEEVLSPNFNTDTKDLFNFPELKKMYNSHVDRNDTAYHMNILWATMHFQLWYKRFLS